VSDKAVPESEIFRYCTHRAKEYNKRHQSSKTKRRLQFAKVGLQLGAVSLCADAKAASVFYECV
jgi:hypothetical protein